MRYLGEQERVPYSGSVHSLSCLAMAVEISCFKSTCYDFSQVHLHNFKVASLDDCINAKSFCFASPK